jgi:aminoglycoside phosphotransferase (APT) family kinase protein
VGLNAEEMRPALEAFIAERAGVPGVRIAALERFGTGAVQENWRIDAAIDGKAATLVLRTSSASAGVNESMRREHEFALLNVVHAAGVPVPEPLWLALEPGVIGRPFYIARFVPGTAAAYRLVRDPSLGDALAERLGEVLARIHAIPPGHPGLAFLEMPRRSPAQDGVARIRAFLDRHPVPHPALEWVLRWLELNEPACPALTLAHRDFRTGNYLVEQGELRAVLDWEFAGWSDPNEDIGWLCARCWRFGSNEREAGGIGSRAAFYRGYERASGSTIERLAIPYWEVMAHARWGYMAIQQGVRHRSDPEKALELALTARVVPELELEAMLLIRAIEEVPQAAEWRS